MAKFLKDKTVTNEDLELWRAKESSFAFEFETYLMIKNVINDGIAGGTCSRESEVIHKGSYLDSLLKKYREFDLRCTVDFGFTAGPQFQVHYAIECKSIGAFAPIVLQGVRADADQEEVGILCQKQLGTGQHAGSEALRLGSRYGKIVAYRFASSIGS